MKHEYLIQLKFPQMNYKVPFLGLPSKCHHENCRSQTEHDKLRGTHATSIEITMALFGLRF